MHETVRHPRRYLFLSLALALAVALVVLGGESFRRKVASFQPLGFEAVSEGGGWRIERVGDAATHLQRGDVLLLIQGEQAADEKVLSERLRARAESQLLIRRGEVLEPVTYVRPPLEIRYSYLVLAVIGILYLLIGLYTALKDRHLHARLFFLWCLASAALYILSPVLPPEDRTDEGIFLVDLLARTWLPGLTLHLFLVFPTRLLAAGWRRALLLLYVPGALFFAFHVDQIYNGARVFGTVSDRTLWRIDKTELALLVGFGLLAAFTVLVRVLRRDDWEPRRQVQWILAGMIGGYLPFVALYMVPYVAGLSFPEWINALAVLPLVLVPLGFAYAILKYKLRDIGIILRDSISTVAAALVGIFAFSLIQLALERGLASDQSVLRNLLTFAAGLAIAGVWLPTRNVIAAGLESFQYRHSLAPRRALRELGHELLYERDLRRLTLTLSDRLSEGLMVEANLFVLQGDSLKPVQERPELPATLRPNVFGAEFWEREVDSLSPIHLPADEVPAEQRLFAAGYRYAFPLTVRGHRVGIMLVSHKVDQEPLSSEELELTRALLNQAALAIENAQLLGELHARLDELGRLEARTKGIIESSPAGIALIDAEDRVISANHAFLALVGREHGQALRRPVRELVPIHPLPDPEDGLVAVSYGDASGREHYLELSVAPYVRGEGREDLRVLLIQDVSEREALEQELKEKERLAALGMLAAGVAHEVNTPLTGISSYAQMLLAETPESDPHYAILKKVERQTFRAAQIVNNLLEFSRHRHHELIPVDLASVLRECLHMLEERANDHGIGVLFETPGEALIVLGHEGELNQVFNNLIVNALDAMATEGGELRIAVEARDERILVGIRDTGPGIPPERLETIFKPFFSSKLGKGGTGLGLAIAHNIVRRHRGEIHVENHYGRRGCTFTVDLPRARQR